MMEKYIFLVIVLLISLNETFSQNDEEILQSMRVDVVYLSADLLEGRETGKRGEQWAAEYIANRFKEIGIAPKGTDDYFQAFDFEYKSNPHVEKGERRTGKNVVAYIDNDAENTVVIGAHYDHVGYGHFGSLWDGEEAIHNGADDNASGVAAMLTLAKALKNSDLENNNYLFIGFSGEEMGLYGSKYYLKNATIDTSSINYMINMDMVGRLNKEKVLAINGAGTSPSWKPIFNNIKVDDIKVKTTDSGIGPSDHTSFYLENIPAVHFFTGQHRDYHKPSDDSYLVNYKGLLSVSKFIYYLIYELNDDGKIAFTKTKDNEDRKAAAFKVTLGVMPDYVYDGTGMRVDGILEGRPAEKAGMERGDVVIKLGDIEVKDIYNYMEALSKFKKGETTKVKVKRGEEEKELEVTF